MLFKNFICIIMSFKIKRQNITRVISWWNGQAHTFELEIHHNTHTRTHTHILFCIHWICRASDTHLVKLTWLLVALPLLRLCWVLLNNLSCLMHRLHIVILHPLVGIWPWEWEQGTGTETYGNSTCFPTLPKHVPGKLRETPSLSSVCEPSLELVLKKKSLCFSFGQGSVWVWWGSSCWGYSLINTLKLKRKSFWVGRGSL